MLAAATVVSKVLIEINVNFGDLYGDGVYIRHTVGDQKYPSPLEIY